MGIALDSSWWIWERCAARSGKKVTLVYKRTTTLLWYCDTELCPLDSQSRRPLVSFGFSQWEECQKESEVKAFIQADPSQWGCYQPAHPCKEGHSLYQAPSLLKSHVLWGQTPTFVLVPLQTQAWWWHPTVASLGALHPLLWFCYVFHMPV